MSSSWPSNLEMKLEKINAISDIVSNSKITHDLKMLIPIM